MKPSVGRIVHYVSYGTPGGEYPSVCRAAIITDAESSNETCSLVLNPEGMFFNPTVIHSEITVDGKHNGGTWHWPERVE